jgi:hypothetical protein
MMPSSSPRAFESTSKRADVALVELLARISDLKLGDQGVEDMRRLYSGTYQAQRSLLDVPTEWVRANQLTNHPAGTGDSSKVGEDAVNRTRRQLERPRRAKRRHRREPSALRLTRQGQWHAIPRREKVEIGNSSSEEKIHE